MHEFIYEKRAKRQHRRRQGKFNLWHQRKSFVSLFTICQTFTCSYIAELPPLSSLLLIFYPSDDIHKTFRMKNFFFSMSAMWNFFIRLVWNIFFSAVLMSFSISTWKLAMLLLSSIFSELMTASREDNKKKAKKKKYKFFMLFLFLSSETFSSPPRRRFHIFFFVYAVMPHFGCCV